MKTKVFFRNKAKWAGVAAGVTIGWMCWNSGTGLSARAQAAPSPGLEGIVKLSNAKMSDDVILSYIKSSGTTYNLSSDDILYLNKQGVSQNIIAVLLASKPAGAPGGASAPEQASPPDQGAAPDQPPTPVPAPPQSAPPPGAPPPNYAPAPSPTAYAPAPGDPTTAPPPTFESFHDQLSPYGEWVSTPDGQVWRPSVPAGWRPYRDSGNWVYSDAGWYWQSDLPWGDIAFHYGRWYYSPTYSSWLWAPGYDFAPAWVTWRHSDGYLGWAPLPPAARFQVGVGLMYNGRVGVDLDFGVPSANFCFVANDHFWDHDLHLYMVPRVQVNLFFGHSIIANGYRFDGGHFVVEGWGREHIGFVTHHEVLVVRAHDIRIREVSVHREIRERDREIVRRGGHVDAIHGGERHDEHGRDEHGHEAEHHDDKGHGPAPASHGPAPASHAAPGKSDKKDPR